MAEISSKPAAASAGVGSRVAEVWASVRRWAASTDAQVLACLLALCLLVRVLRLQPIEYYEDEVTRWHFVRDWFYSNSFRHGPWTHHMARFGVNVPLYFAQLFLGRHASVYYVWPVTAFALQVALVYLATKRLSGRAAGVFAALLLSLFSGMDRGASQLLPDGIGAAAIALVFYLLVRYQEPEAKHPLRWLVGAGLAFVWAYEIKESNLLFVPGLCLAVWLCRGRFRDGVLFACILFAGIAVETAYFRIFTDYSSRFAIVEESHGIATAKNFWALFDRFTRLELPWQLLVYAWLLSTLWLLGSRDKRRLMLVLIPGTFVFLLTFMVRGIHPLVIWTRFFSRYFEPCAPLFVISVALFLEEAARRIWSAHAPARVSALPVTLGRWPVACTLGVCSVLGVLSYVAEDSQLPSPALTEARLISSITNDAYRRNLPIVQKRAKRGELEERRVRSLKAVYGIYLNDKVIVTSPAAKGGALPDILDTVHDSARYSYVLYDPRAYSEREIEEWVERGCALVVTEAQDHLNAAPKVPALILTQTEKLPDTCQPPRH